MLANQIPLYIYIYKIIHHYWVGLIPEMQGLFSIQKSINTSYPLNKGKNQERKTKTFSDKSSQNNANLSTRNTKGKISNWK